MSKENYSRNQCTLIIRVDGNELELPVNFGMSADEIRAIYPYLAKFASTKIPNPALKFADAAKAGKYTDMEDAEYNALVEKVRRQSDFWYQKPEASLLELGMRFALDFQFKDIQEIQDAFSTVTPFERIKVEQTVSEAEADKILKDTGMETDTDREFDPGDEQDIELGTAGDMHVDIYNSGETTDFLSRELDELESKNVEDRFEKIVNGTAAEELPEKYRSNYKAGGFKENQIGEDGLLNLYDNSGSTDAIFGDEPDDGSTAEELLGDDKPAKKKRGRAKLAEVKQPEPEPEPEQDEEDSDDYDDYDEIPDEDLDEASGDELDADVEEPGFEDPDEDGSDE